MSAGVVCRQFSLGEIEDATKNFENILGHGGEAIVYLGKISAVGSVAVKRFKSKLIGFDEEIDLVSKIKHPNLVTLHGYCDESGQKILVYEYMGNGSLADYISKKRKSRICLSWQQRLNICLGAARGLQYLHKDTEEFPKGIIHRDIKPENILLDDNWVAKVSDFGLCKLSHADQIKSTMITQLKGTGGYYAPEYVNYGSVTRKIDVYAFGVVLFQVLCCKTPWDRGEESYYRMEDEDLGVWACENVDPEINEEISEDCLEAFTHIIGRSLQTNPSIRPTMDDVVTDLDCALKCHVRQDEGTHPKAPTRGGRVSIPGSVRKTIQNIKEMNIKEISENSEDEIYAMLKECSMDLIQTIEKLLNKARKSNETAAELPESSNTIHNARATSGSLNLRLKPAMDKLKFPSDNFLKDFYIPDYILVPGSKGDVLPDAPASPILVFINSRSGGQLGGDLLVTYRSLLNKNQVVDLGEVAPDKVLRQLYLTLESLKANGDVLAPKIQEKLRIIVAGGDGTAGWLLGVVSDLKLSHPPPIATVPLGTENNLPFAFGWGKKNPGTDRNAVLSFLEQVLKAKEMKIDSWHLLMRMKVPKNGPCDPLAPLELPHSLHAFHRVFSTDDLNKEGYDTFRGGFWNYFSMGMNSQGGFMASVFHPSSRNIAQLAKVKIMKRPGEWQDLHIPPSIKSIICLNLPSFSGGLNPWGTPNKKKTRDRDLTPTFVDDGLLEVVGFRDAWHGLVLIAPRGHWTRLAQAHRIRFEFHKAAADCTYMRIDGEPWKQPLPANDDTVVVEISHLGQVTMLATHDCRSKSVYDPSSPSSHGADEDDSDEEEDSVAEGEEWRKFGAADTFRIPDEIDISHLS